VNFPFFYDPRAMLIAAGVDGADQLVPGWGDSFAGSYNAPPTLRVSAAQNAPFGSAVTVTATATDPEDGDLSSGIEWSDLAMPFGARAAGKGASFTVVPDSLGVHELSAVVTDRGAKSVVSSVRVTVQGTLPSFQPVRLAADGSGSGIELDPGGLSVRYTGNGKMGIRANQGLLRGFQYFEIHREIAPVNMGGGLVTADGNLNPYGPVDVPPSSSVNVLGGTWQDLIYRTSYPDLFARESYYGFAVDYRGTHPIAYVIVGSQVIDVIAMTDVTVPIYPMLYGNPTGSAAGPDETINFGEAPFHYSPSTVLGAAGIDLGGFRLGWVGGN
jgi:hypothetical protein